MKDKKADYKTKRGLKFEGDMKASNATKSIEVKGGFDDAAQTKSKNWLIKTLEYLNLIQLRIII
mgnify:CR=1 FL=1